ncbi:MAG: phosphate/phosphite/phosphonate ABC transporter substrate-binding protein [Desulfurivibrionaceae bacterium]
MTWAFCHPTYALADPPPKTLLFGVLNQQSPIQTAERWNPILRYLSRKTGIPLQLKMGATVEQTDAMMGREEFDLVYSNHNFQSDYDGKYRVLARWAGKPIHGVLAVLHDSPITVLRELHGRTVAFPSEDAFVAYAVPMVALKEAGVGVNAKFAGNQEGALAQLKARQVQAATVNSRFLETYAKRENLHYRKVFVSAPFHELPVLIHPRVPAEQAAALRKALLEMRSDPEAAEALALCPGFEPAEERDYDDARRIYRAIGK